MGNAFEITVVGADEGLAFRFQIDSAIGRLKRIEQLFPFLKRTVRPDLRILNNAGIQAVSR